MICPFCKEQIKDGAIKCKHCKSMLTPSASTSQPGGITSGVTSSSRIPWYRQRWFNVMLVCFLIPLSFMVLLFVGFGSLSSKTSPQQSTPDEQLSKQSAEVIKNDIGCSCQKTFDHPKDIVWEGIVIANMMSGSVYGIKKIPEDSNEPYFYASQPENVSRDRQGLRGKVRITGKWTGITCAYANTIFHRCVPRVEIEEIDRPLDDGSEINSDNDVNSHKEAEKGGNKEEIAPKDVVPSDKEMQPDSHSETQVSKGIKYVREMISLAMAEGGANDEEGILAARRHIEELNIKSGIIRRGRKQAREFNEKALTYLQTGQWVEAAKELQIAIEADPADVEVMNNLGYALMRCDKSEDAEQWLIRTLVFAPGRSAAWENLGDVYAKQRRVDEAVACFSHVYRFSRDRDATLRFFRKMLEDEDSRLVEVAKKLLELKIIKPDSDNFIAKSDESIQKEKIATPASLDDFSFAGINWNDDPDTVREKLEKSGYALSVDWRYDEDGSLSSMPLSTILGGSIDCYGDKFSVLEDIEGMWEQELQSANYSTVKEIQFVGKEDSIVKDGYFSFTFRGNRLLAYYVEMNTSIARVSLKQFLSGREPIPEFEGVFGPSGEGEVYHGLIKKYGNPALLVNNDKSRGWSKKDQTLYYCRGFALFSRQGTITLTYINEKHLSDYIAVIQKQKETLEKQGKKKQSDAVQKDF